jgi:hypothetical protein
VASDGRERAAVAHAPLKYSAGVKGDGELIHNEATMLEEKLKEAIISELKRQAANSPRSLQVDDSKELVIKGKIDIDALVMVIAGSVAGGP